MSRFSSLIGNKADRILGMTAAAVAATTGAGIVGTTSTAEADVVDSGAVNIVIPNNIDGIYMNILNGNVGTSGAGVTGWDINPYSASAGSFNLWGPTVNTWYSAGGVNAGPYNLPGGTVIGGAAAGFFRPGGATNIAPQMNLNSSDNYLGFMFVNEDNSDLVHYGWLQLEFGATAGDRAIVRYAYESDAGVSITVPSAIPEPSTLALLALGATGLIARRRRAC